VAQLEGAVQKVIPKAAQLEEAVHKAAKDKEAGQAQLEIPLEAVETTTLQKGSNKPSSSYHQQRSPLQTYENPTEAFDSAKGVKP
jgi:hypothetical protein